MSPFFVAVSVNSVVGTVAERLGMWEFRLELILGNHVHACFSVIFGRFDKRSGSDAVSSRQSIHQHTCAGMELLAAAGAEMGVRWNGRTALHVAVQSGPFLRVSFKPFPICEQKKRGGMMARYVAVRSAVLTSIAAFCAQSLRTRWSGYWSTWW